MGLTNVRGISRATGVRLVALLATLLVVMGPFFAAPAFASETESVPDPAAEQLPPLPGQSDQPAPPTEARVLLDHGHVDAFTPMLNADGSLRLTVKEDVTALNTERAPESVVLHVKESAFEGMPQQLQQTIGIPAEVYHLPLTQDPDLVWPGWETQLITSGYPDANTDIVVSEVDGPGEVFLWSQGTFGDIVSLMHGAYRFPATISQPFPAHTHAAWAFTEPGVYTFTVRAEVRASNGATATTQTAEYLFVVGELMTTTTLSADSATIDPGEPVTLTAQLLPEHAAGVVQFRDITDPENDSILGHSTLNDDGTAAFRTAALPSGERRIIAEFVPRWSNTYTPSHAETVITVSGEAIPAPEHDDTHAVSETDIAVRPEAEGVQVTSPQQRVDAGAVITARVDDVTLAGDWVSVWLHGAAGAQRAPVWLGWSQLYLPSNLTAAIPQQTEPGEYRLVVKDRSGALLGWDGFTVPHPEVSPNPQPTPAPPAPPPPIVPPQECQPAVTLETGHIDAFTVSAGGGMAVLQILEDVTGHRVLREVETVLLRVREQAFTSIPAGIPGGPSGYVLPLTQNPALIWPGWETNRTTASGYTDVSINVTGVSGPGQVYLYTSQGSFGGWRPILTHGGYTFPGTIREPTPAHTHAQWVFSQPGIYVLSAHAVATNPNTGASLTTASHNYVFQVGDVPLGDVFCGLSAHGAGASAMVNAAVHQAGLEAIAAEQAEAEASEAEERRRARAARERANAQADAAESQLGSGLGEGLHPAMIAGVVGGGLLVIAGVAGGTVWYLRRVDSGG